MAVHQLGDVCSAVADQAGDVLDPQAPLRDSDTNECRRSRGVHSLVGNVWEWTSTPSTPGRYELKGSAFTSPAFRGKPAAFNDANDFMRGDDTGFRCSAISG